MKVQFVCFKHKFALHSHSTLSQRSLAFCWASHRRLRVQSVACISSAAIVESQAARQQPRAREPVAKSCTSVHTSDLPLQKVVARESSLRKNKQSFRLERRSMTVRFRPVEATELVDDERAAAQRIYMGPAITMEQGKLARSLAPCRCSCLHYAPATPPTSAANHRVPKILSPFLQPPAAGPKSAAFICRSLTTNWPTSMLETGLFRFSIGCTRNTLPTKHLPLGAV